MARDKGCSWHFELQTGVEEGPNDALAQNFKKSPYTSLIRESVQNSLDAVYDRTQPVRVVIETKSMRVVDFPSFFDLREHIQGCIDYFPMNSNAKEIYEPMLPYIDASSYSNELHYIKVSDFNTMGMKYVKGDTNCPFYAFVLSRGVSAKENQASGGSFGFGKAAYFNMSPIRTVFVSTMMQGGMTVFEGVASLCTHIHKGKVKTSMGYYDNNDGKPVVNSDNIPVPFKREKPGTSICIMGVNKSLQAGATKEMIEAVLRHFWMAIWSEKLVVEIEDVKINKENIERLMEEYFKSDLDTVAKTNYHNPRPYFDAVRYAGSDSNRYFLFKDNLPILGQVEFYVNLNPSATDKISYMRKPLMLVYTKKTQTSFGFNGVFICTGDSGNQVLRKVENPAHDEWKAENWKDKNNKTEKKGKEALEELQSYLSRTIEKLFSSDEGGSINITDLEEYLFVPEDLASGQPESTPRVQQETTIGRPSGEYKDDGASATTEIKNEEPEMEPNQSSQTGHVIIMQSGNVKPSSSGSRNVGTGNKHKGADRKIQNPGAGQKFKESEIDDIEEGSYLEYIPVTFRVIAEKENGKMYHSIIFHSPQATSRGEIELIIGGEQNDEIPEIAEVLTQPSGIRDNFITNLQVVAGKNIVKLRFNDNMKHAIILKAYERK